MRQASGISVSQSAVKTGDTFTVSVQVPAISTNLSNFKLSVAFDKTAFELTGICPCFSSKCHAYIINIS